MIDRARPVINLVVVVERHRPVVCREAEVGLLMHAEVARVAGAAIDVGVLAIHVVGIVTRAHAAHQTGAVLEHALGITIGRQVPSAAGINGGQIAASIEHVRYETGSGGVEIAQVKARQGSAVLEHVAHVAHIGGVETAQVNARQARAAKEHTLHISHIGSVETAQVKARQATAVIKHGSHVCYLRRVQVTEAREALQISHTEEPICG